MHALRAPRIPLLLALPLLLAGLLAAAATGPWRAAGPVGEPVPTPVSAAVGRFVEETDHEFGYRMLRPAG